MHKFLILSDQQEQYANLKCKTATPTIKAIAGKITNKCGKGIECASIKAVTTTFEPISHTISNNDGEYTLFIPNTINIKMIVSKEGYSTINTDIIQCQKQNFVLLPLDKDNCIVKGRIWYNNCKLGNNLRVRITSANYNNYCFTSEDGIFIFTKVPAENYILTIEGNECKKKSIDITVEKNKDYYQLSDVIVEQKMIGATLHGIVTDNTGNPISNAVIILYNQRTQAIVCHTRSNLDGVYFFGNLLVGNYYVEAYC